MSAFLIRWLRPLIFSFIAIAIYASTVFYAIPRDIGFFDYWSAIFAVNNQPTAFAAGTLLFIFGISLCIFGLFFTPRHNALLKYILSVPGFICAIIGVFYVYLLIICNVDKVRL